MLEMSEDDAPRDTRSPREKELEERLGSRTILVVLLIFLALVEAIVIMRLAY
jgi:hypothetical protein